MVRRHPLGAIPVNAPVNEVVTSIVVYITRRVGGNVPDLDEVFTFESQTIMTTPDLWIPMGLVYEAANFKTKHMGSTTMAPVMVEHNITPSTPAVMQHLHDCITEIHTFALQVEGLKNAAAALAAATYSITTPVDNHLRKLRVSTYCFSALSARNFKHVMSSNPEKKFKNFVATASCTRAVALSNLPAIYQRVKRVREEEEEDNDDEGDDADEEVVA